MEHWQTLSNAITGLIVGSVAVVAFWDEFARLFEALRSLVWKMARGGMGK